MNQNLLCRIGDFYELSKVYPYRTAILGGFSFFTISGNNTCDIVTEMLGHKPDNHIILEFKPKIGESSTFYIQYSDDIISFGFSVIEGKW